MAEFVWLTLCCRHHNHQWCNQHQRGRVRYDKKVPYSKAGLQFFVLFFFFATICNPHLLVEGGRLSELILALPNATACFTHPALIHPSAFP